MAHEDLYPSERATIRLGGKNDHVGDNNREPDQDTQKSIWFDVHFYPYASRDVDPVFAVTGANVNTAVFRCIRETREVQPLRFFMDKDGFEEDISDPDEAQRLDASRKYEKLYGSRDKFQGKVLSRLNSIEWSRSADGDPLLCVAGCDPRINVLNVITGDLEMTLESHGGLVTDLRIRPTDHTILASCAYDRYILLWTLDPQYGNKKVVAMLFGDGGHKYDVLALGWHKNGRYLLSGSMDTAIKVWMIPEDLKEYLGTDKPKRIDYPHFSSTDVHDNYVDCVAFYNDLIFSRAAQSHEIVMWKIDHFDSNSPPPNAPIPPSRAVRSDSPVTVPTEHLSGTLSAWGGKFQRLLSFNQPFSDPFSLRFGLLDQVGMHPMLAAGNENSKIYIWDLQKLETIGVGDDRPAPESKKKRKRKRPEGAPSDAGKPGPKGLILKADSVYNATDNGKDYTTGTGTPYNFTIPAHKTLEHGSLGKFNFAIQAVSWSCDGEWLVAVGNTGLIYVADRSLKSTTAT